MCRNRAFAAPAAVVLFAPAALAQHGGRTCARRNARGMLLRQFAFWFQEDFGLSAVRSFVRTVANARGSSHPLPRLYHGYRRGKEDGIPVSARRQVRKDERPKGNQQPKGRPLSRQDTPCSTSQTDRSRVPFRRPSGAAQCTSVHCGPVGFTNHSLASAANPPASLDVSG